MSTAKVAKKSKVKLPAEVTAWEKQTGFEAAQARVAVTNGTSIADGFQADLKWFHNWYHERLQEGTRAYQALCEAEPKRSK
jgi:hypothetical protein